MIKPAPDYCYIKEYELKTNGGCLLKNPESALSYIQNKINQLLSVKDKSEERSIKSCILSEFLQIYEYDCNNAIRPEPFGYFNNQKEKEDLNKLNQLVDDLYLYIGNIFSNYHYYMFKDGRNIPILSCDTFIIDYNELYLRAINEYYCTLMRIPIPEPLGSINNTNRIISQKKNEEKLDENGVKIEKPDHGKNKMPQDSEHACGTTYILPALIEHFLLLYLQNRILFKGINEINLLSNRGEIVLEDSEKNIINDFINAKEAGSAIFSGTKVQTMNKVFRIFVDHKVLEANDEREQFLVGNKKNKPTTLGSVFHSTFVKNELRPEYYELLLNLFDTNKMNIRNCIMHGNCVTYDYLAIGLTSIMLQLLWDIAYGDIFID